MNQKEIEEFNKNNPWVSVGNKVHYSRSDDDLKIRLSEVLKVNKAGLVTLKNGDKVESCYCHPVRN